MAVNEDQFEPFERKWLDSSPENAIVRVFLPADVRTAASAFGTLIHELAHTAFHVAEPQVAAAKLGWWRQEFADAHAGRGRHPVTRLLFDEVRLRESDVTPWSALADAALGQIEAQPAPDLSGLLERLRPWHLAVVTAQSVVLTGADAQLPRDADLLSVSHLLHTFADAGVMPEQLALPLNLLASHGLTRETARSRDPNATAFAHAYLDALRKVLDKAMQQGTINKLPIRVRARLDSALMAAAARASNPLDHLVRHGRAGHWRCLHVCWREARALARQAGSGP